jgi:hypothetical protein
LFLIPLLLNDINLNKISLGIAGKHREMEIDISWTTYLSSSVEKEYEIYIYMYIYIAWSRYWMEQILPGSDIDSDHNFLVSKICTRPKKSMRLQKIKPRWDLEKLCAEIY